MNGPTLLILAAGMGSRYGGLKQLDPVGPGGETLLDYSVFDALAAGFQRLVFVIRRDFEKDFLERVVARYPCDSQVVFQEIGDLPPGVLPPADRTKPWGTAHAIRAARHAVKTPFLAINADDFYGREAYVAMAGHLAASKDFAMAGYHLAATLSDHGAVSRGVCHADPEGWLISVEEFTDIVRSGDGAVSTAGGRTAEFSGNEPVSLNFWGFTPEVFGLLDAGFAAFIQEHGQSLKSEYYIPSAIAGMIRSGAARVKILPTPSQWFGVTYREDRPIVASRLAGLVASGRYPCPLPRP